MKVLRGLPSAVTALSLMISSVAVCYADSIFYENGYYYTFINNDSVSLTGWDNRSSIIPVPAALNGRALVSIAKHTFSGDDFITGLDFTNALNLSSIGMYAFSECSSLSEKLVLPDTITYIGDCAFEGCTALSEVELNADLSYVPIQCFHKCDSLTKVTVNGFVEEIDSFAFADCPSLEYVYLPASVTYIADTAFDNDPALTIFCELNSSAHNYAMEHSIPYVLTNACMVGDVNGDNNINIVDVTRIQQHLAELFLLKGIYLSVADTNDDGVLDISDATAVQMYSAGFDVDFPIGQYITE